MNAVVKDRGIPTGWELVPLKELGHWSGGGTPSKAKSEYWTNGKIPWVSPKDMKTEHIIDSEDHITKAAVEESTAKLIPAGSVLVVTRSGILSHTLPVAVTTVPVTVNQDLKAITPRDGILPEYVAWALRCSARTILRTCSKQGTTVASVETTALQRFRIPVAPLDQQQRIVAEIEKQFSRLDEAVANLKRVKANLKRYKAAVLKAAVEGRLVETEAELARREGRSYETGEQLLQRILETRRSQWKGKGKYKEPAAPDTADLPELPEGWARCSGAQFFDWSSGEGLTEKKQRPGPYPVYGGNGINGHHDEYFVEEPTIVVGRVGAYCGNVYVTTPKCWITDNAIYAKSIPVDTPLQYLQIVFTQAGLNRVAAGSGQPFVNQQMLNEVSIPLSPLPEQLRILGEVDRRLSLVREVETQVDANLQRAAHMRRALLSSVFSGKLVSRAREQCA